MGNPLRMDPTRTGAERRAFLAAISRRFDELRRDLWVHLAEDGGLGPVGNAYSYPTADAKLKAFRRYLTRRADERILNPVGGQPGKPWTAPFIESAYRKGLVRAYTDTRKTKLFGKPAAFQRGSQAEFLRAAFGGPVARSKIELLATRDFEQLKGINAQMGSKLNVILADGMSASNHPRVIAKRISGEIDKIKRTRANTLARTEIIHAHAEGQLDSFEQMGITHVAALVEWMTAGDDRVCPRCEQQMGRVFTIDQARGLIPLHPNCRCMWVPYFPKQGGKK